VFMKMTFVNGGNIFVNFILWEAMDRPKLLLIIKK
jgi:hypothetical protein